MESLFESATNQKIIDRINKINPYSKAEWGKMNVAQMLAHAQAPFKVANEELKLKRGLVGILFGGMARKQLTGPKPFEKNLPTDKNFLVTGNPDFQLEKANLIELVNKFYVSGPTGITKNPHPFFGRLTIQEWDTLLYKHLDHHLRQFGV
jgi:hypothetical protein